MAEQNVAATCTIRSGANATPSRMLELSPKLFAKILEKTIDSNRSESKQEILASEAETFLALFVERQKLLPYTQTQMKIEGIFGIAV